MIKKLTALLLFLHFSVAYSQTIKTDVLVIGGTPSGVAAAIQSARSKVKTVLVESSSRLCPDMTGSKMQGVEPDRNLPSGIWGEFQRNIIQHYHKIPGYDTTYNRQLKLEPDTGASILSAIADTVKNLTVKLNASFSSIKKDDDRWDVIINEHGKEQLIKARVVIDATASGIVVSKAGATYVVKDNWQMDNGTKAYRTSIAMGSHQPHVLRDSALYKANPSILSEYYVPIKDVLATGADNLLVIGKQWKHWQGDIAYFRAELNLGQGAGVVAAYCTFFKTTTNNLRVRAIQVELLDFKSCLLPFDDMGADPYWRSIQQVCATGLLKGVVTGELMPRLLFQPDSTVTTAEVKPVLTEIYTRAFLWFNTTKPGKEFTVGNLLSFISELTLTDPDNLQRKIEKEWSAQYKFKSTFDIERPITRREFAILANKYLNPFARTVDLDGRVVN